MSQQKKKKGSIWFSKQVDGSEMIIIAEIMLGNVPEEDVEMRRVTSGER